jgi:molybdopterin molybdotransferase
MLEPGEALARILARIVPIGDVEEVPLVHASGRILARSPVSDVDLPPFRKAMMDGYAMRSEDGGGPRNDSGELTLVCVGESRAGAAFDGAVGPGQCVEIFTGAPVPEDCDSVVVVERTRRSANRVLLDDRPRAGQHVARRGEVLEKGAALFEPGRRLRPHDLGALAAIGAHPLLAYRRPRVAVLTTGDELVPPWEVPGHDQIREGNTLQLAARCLELELEVTRVGIAPDDEDVLGREFEQALAVSDALITTGGVSAGKYDLVGRTFERLGVEPVLHKIAIKPGKPIWFGMQGRKPVFGLPGNPVSALLGMEVFVRPALARLGGAVGEELAEELRSATWGGPDVRADERQQNLPARLEHVEGAMPRLVPVEYKGSADVVAVTRANALAIAPAGRGIHPGEVVLYRPIPR